jgi:hypothetical protein
MRLGLLLAYVWRIAATLGRGAEPHIVLTSSGERTGARHYETGTVPSPRKDTTAGA